MKLIQALVPCIPASLAIWLAVQHQALIKLTSQHQLLEQEVRQMNDLTARNAQLSNLVAEANGPESLPQDQLLELLRLRGQAGALSRQQSELNRVREENRQAHAVLGSYLNTETNRTATVDYWPRDSWTNSGYGSPDAALQTVLWATYNGDVTNLLASIAGQALDDFGKEYKGKSEAEISARVMDDTYHFNAARILSRQMPDDNTVLLTVEWDLQDDSQTGIKVMVMKKTDGEWKFTGPQP